MKIIGIIELLKEIGVFEFYLPFIILFGLIYGLLEKSKIIPERRLNVVIGLASAAFIMAYTPVGVTLTEFFSSFFTDVAVILVTCLSFVMIFYLLVPVTGKKEFPGAAKYVALIAFLVVVGIFVSSGGLKIIIPSMPEAMPQAIDPQDIIIILLILIFILIVVWIAKGEGKKEKPSEGYLLIPRRGS